MLLQELSPVIASKCRVLVVEDDRASRSALTALLRLIGFEPLAAATVEEGIQLLEMKPLCVILDLMLPDGNGASVLRYVREHRLPIRVAITTGAMDWKAMIAQSPEPPDAMFPKPLDFDLLTNWLHANCHTPASS